MSRTVRERMQDIAQSVDDHLPEGYGFIVLTFEFGNRAGTFEYVANGKREDCVKAMKEFIERSESRWGTHAAGKILTGQWNYEPCEVVIGSVKCGRVPVPTWWCKELEGKRVDCLRITYGGDDFFILDDDEARDKVFKRGGGPDSGHKSIPVDDPNSFQEREVQL